MNRKHRPTHSYSEHGHHRGDRNSPLTCPPLRLRDQPIKHKRRLKWTRSHNTIIDSTSWDVKIKNA